MKTPFQPLGRYGREPGLVLLILLIGVAFSVVAPLMTPFALAYMATSWVVWRYQIIYVCVRCYESGGRMWTLYFKVRGAEWGVGGWLAGWLAGRLGS
jgi:hypothetical protein